MEDRGGQHNAMHESKGRLSNPVTLAHRAKTFSKKNKTLTVSKKQETSKNSILQWFMRFLFVLLMYLSHALYTDGTVVVRSAAYA